MTTEKLYEIIDPKSKKKHKLKLADLWRLTFGAAGKYCHEKTKGMVGEQKRKAFAWCMVETVQGLPTEEKAQRIVNLAMFPVDEYVERLETRRLARELPSTIV